MMDPIMLIAAVLVLIIILAMIFGRLDLLYGIVLLLVVIVVAALLGSAELH